MMVECTPKQHPMISAMGCNGVLDLRCMVHALDNIPSFSIILDDADSVLCVSGEDNEPRSGHSLMLTKYNIFNRIIMVLSVLLDKYFPPSI
jgi:hypothetical protein